MKTVDQLTEVLRIRGMKVTPQRQSVFRALCSMHGSHPTAEAVHAAVVVELPMVSLKTVYATLNELVAMGELRQLTLSSGPARFDCNLDVHQHLACDQCGRAWDVYTDVGADALPGGDMGFAVAATDVVYRGICAACAPTDVASSA